MSRTDTLREDLGGAHPLAVNKVRPYLEPPVRAFVEQATFAVMASASADGDCDASPKGGRPGWVRVVDERTLLIPDIGGNRLFQSYANFESNPKVGFVFFIPGIDVTVRVNGRVRILEGDEAASAGLRSDVNRPDDNVAVVQAIEVSVDEAYFHCPRSMRFGDVWNAEAIGARAGQSLKSVLGI